MTRWLIKTRFARLSDAVFETTCGAILLLMSGNPSYTTPNPTLISLGTLLTAYHDALVAWGPEGNRGSHAQHIAVLDTRFALEVGMVSLSDYCMTTTPYDRTAFVSAGWEVKKEAAPIGPLPAAANLRVASDKNTPNGGIKLRWKRVYGAGSYNVLRSDDDGATFDVVANVTKGSFIDTGLDSSKTYQYAVQAIGAAGVGVNSDICFAQPVMDALS